MTGSAVVPGLAGLHGSAATEPVLAVRGLSVQFRGERGWATAVRDVDFEVGPRECLGLVGESGSGKSVSALSILGLHDKRNTRLSGQVLFGGRDLLATPERAMRRIRGREIAMVFQDPMSSLNPVLTLAEQLIEPLRLHQGLDERAARQRALALLSRLRRMSGGQVESFELVPGDGVAMVAAHLGLRPPLSGWHRFVWRALHNGHAPWWQWLQRLTS